MGKAKKKIVIEEKDKIVVEYGGNEFALVDIDGKPYVPLGFLAMALKFQIGPQNQKVKMYRDEYKPVKISINYPGNSKKGLSRAVPLSRVDLFLSSFKGRRYDPESLELVKDFRENLIPELKRAWRKHTEPEPVSLPDVIDRKFKILAVNPCNGKHYTENDGVFFCAKDLAFLSGALPGYRKKCVEIGTNPEHVESVDLLIERVKKYQETVESRVPDTVGDCELDRCIGGLVG